jgi:uncharacterized membrane protein
MKLSKKLDTWLKHKLIDKQQYQRILAFEGEHASNSSWFLYGFLILGAVTTGIGVISLIANNWAAIPAIVKLGLDFLLLIAIAVGIYRLHGSEHSVWFEVLLVAFQILVLASIGLISQIYHVQGEIYTVLLVWSVMTFWASLYARQYVSPFLWVSLFIIGLSWSVLDWQVVLLEGEHWWSVEQPLNLLFVFTVFISLLLSHLSLRFHYDNFASSFQLWFIVSGVTSLVYADLLYWTSQWERTSDALMLPAYLLVAGFIVYTYFRKELPRYNRTLMMLASVLFLLLFRPEWLMLTGNDDSLLKELFAPVLIISILLLYALHVGSMGRKTLFNVATFLIGIRFLIVYFEVIGDLAMTGIGLIISGLAIIGVTYGWYRSQEALQAWVKQRRQHE